MLYRGLCQNTVRALTKFALSNLYLARRLSMRRQDGWTWLRINVQGYEHQVLQGMTGVIDRYAPAIKFENEDLAWIKAGRDFRRAFDLLDRLGYSLLRKSFGKRPEVFPIFPKRVPGPHAEVLAIARNDPCVQRLSTATSGALGG